MSDLVLKDNPTLADLQAYVAEIVRERGVGVDLAKQFMMLMEESGELARAARKQAGMKFAADTHTAEVEYEAADVLIILLGICNLLGIDLEKAFREKEEHNKKRTWK